MKREEKLIMGSVFGAIAVVSAISLFLCLQFGETDRPFEIESRMTDPPFEIESRMTDHSAGYLVLDPSEVEQLPLIGNVIEAHHNPGSDPNATFEDGVLHYAVYNGTALCKTEAFLQNKYLKNQTFPMPMDFGDEPLLWGIAYDRNDGNGLQFYTWQVSALVYEC